MKVIKRFSLLIFVSLIPFFIFFHPATLFYLSEWILKSCVSSYLGETLCYQKAYLSGNQLVIEHPFFFQKDHFQSECIKIQCDLNWRKRQLNLTVLIDKPSWRLESFHLDWSHLKAFFDEKKIWIKVNPKLKIQDGELLWGSPDQTLSCCYFNLEGDRKTGGYLKLQFDHSPSESNCLTCLASRRQHTVSLNWNCQEVQCSSLLRLMTLFFPHLDSWKVSSGTLKGQLKATIPASRQPYWEGEIYLNNLAFIETITHLNGFVKEASLNLEKVPQLAAKDHTDFNTQSELTLLQPATLGYFEDEKWSWQLEYILGKIRLNNHYLTSFNFSAQGIQKEYHPQFNLNGYVNIDDQSISNVNMTLFCSSKEQLNGEIHFLIHQLNKPSKIVEIECQQLSCMNLQFLQALSSLYCPDIRCIEFQEGTLDGLAHVELTKEGIGNLQFQKIKAKDLRLLVQPLKTVFFLSKCQGQGSINYLAVDKWHSFNAELFLEGGQANLADMSSLQYPITDIHTHLSVYQGSIQHSLVKLKCLGLKGILDVQWGKGKNLITLDLQGQIQHLFLDGFPESLQAKIKNHFYQDSLRLSANFKPNLDQWEIDGFVAIPDLELINHSYLIHFGCDLKQTIEQTIDPTGWFHAKQISLEKFISPFIFEEGSSQLSGLGEFKGSFNRQNVHVNYDVKNVKIENEKFLIQLENLYPTLANPLLGIHEFDLISYSHQGRLPIQHATYFNKHHDLLFNDIQAELIFQNKTLQLHALEAFCKNIYLSGQLDIDYSHPIPGIFCIKGAIPIFHGKISQVQHLLSHLMSASLLEEIPLEGDIESRQNGLMIAAEVTPEHLNLQSTIQGSITNGSILIDDKNMAIQGLYMDFDYQHQKEQLEFTDIQGTLLIGKPQQVKEYTLTGHHVRLQDLINQNIEVDLAISDQIHQLARLVGYTQRKDPLTVEWIIDQSLSHLGSIYPQQLQLIVKDGTAIQHFHLKTQFNFQPVWKNLQYLLQGGFFKIFDEWQIKFNEGQDLTGECFILMNYDSDPDLLHYELIGKDIKLNEFSYQNCFLKGKKQGKKWVIDHLQLDQLSLYAEIQNRQDKWKLDFLGFNYGQSILMGMSGDLIPESKQINAKVNLLEVKLAQLNECKYLQPFYAEYRPDGYMEGNGKIKIQLLSQAPWYRVESDLQLNFSQIKCRECPVRLLSPLTLQICSDRDITLNQIHAVIDEGLCEQAYMTINELHYNLNQKQLYCPQLTIMVPCEYLTPIGEKLQHHFSDWVDQRFINTLVSLKSEGNLIAKIAFDKNPNTYFCRLTLDPGTYTFKKRHYDLQNFDLILNPNQIKFSALSREERCPFNVIGKANWPEMSEGELILTDVFYHHPLQILWKDHFQHGFTIHSIKGYFCGLNINLDEAPLETRGPPSWTSLQGNIEIDFNRLCPLLRQSLAEKIPKLELGPRYEAQGIWWMNPDQGKTLLETVYFQGVFSGQEAILKGYQVEKVLADVNYVPQRLEAKNVVIEDAAGKVSCSELTLIKKTENDNWLLFIPHLMVENLRPSLLREVGYPTTSHFKTLLVKRIHFNHFFGDLDDISSWQSMGRLYFLNPSKKNLSHPLLAIPAELILRLGLNLEVLNPVTGSIYFHMQGDRFYLTKFKDVYSEGRGSKFYLVQSKQPSWMDILGNLSVHIRMKQYNLIFKIAELFTVSIQGNIKHPIYTLQKYAK